MMDNDVVCGVAGAGSWGSALALMVARGGTQVRLWAHRTEFASELKQAGENRKYLPGQPFPENVSICGGDASLAAAGVVLFVVPTSAFRQTAERLRDEGAIRPGAALVSCSKGIEAGSSKSMTEILKEVFPAHPVGVLSGPNHAEEVARSLPTAAVIGAENAETAEALQAVLNQTWFRCYTSEDIRGIEWAGAMKNVFAVAAGVCEGLRLGDNAKAALVTRAVAEMVRVGSARGGHPATFYGLSGVGDLVATCFSEHSRNLRVGRELAAGRTMPEIVDSLGMVAEGIPNTRNLYHFAREKDIRTPIIDAAYSMLYENRPPRHALVELLSRDPRPENS